MTPQTDSQPPSEPSKEKDAKPTTSDLARSGAAAEPQRAAEEPRSFGEAEVPSGTAEIAHAGEPAPEREAAASLFPGDEARSLSERWDAIQASFVDEPRKAVEDADSLVASAMKRLAEMFADERAKLEGQWDRGDDVSTEDLRLALRRYRAFFGRLLAV